MRRMLAAVLALLVLFAGCARAAPLPEDEPPAAPARPEGDARSLLDGEGRALALMRSWFSAMPGETLSCIGCHERQNCAPPARAVMASRQKPAPIVPWYGPARTFSFMNEVQPVLDRHCIRCHTAEC